MSPFFDRIETFVILTSSTIDKKLKIDENPENELEIDKKKTKHFESNFEGFYLSILSLFSLI